MYFNGQGISQDHQEAVKWITLSADQGEVESQKNLGIIYRDGEVVPQDYQTAAKWFELAATQGNITSQINIGFFY